MTTRYSYMLAVAPHPALLIHLKPALLLAFSLVVGLDLVCHLAMTCTNTKKELFPVAYPL